MKQALKKDLRHGRRWSILVDGFVADNGDSIPGLGLGLLLLCGPAVAQKKVICPYMQEESNNLHYSYNTTGYTDPYLKSRPAYAPFSLSLSLSLSLSHTHRDRGCVRLCGQQRKACYIMVDYSTTMISTPSQKTWGNLSSLMQD